MTTEIRTKLVYPPGNDSKPKRGPDGLYHFICEFCFKPYTAKNLFSKTCSQLCRNSKNYSLRNTKYGDDISYIKKSVSNVKVLSGLFEQQIYEPTIDVLNIMKFNFEVKGSLETVNNVQVRFFGNYGLIAMNTQKFKIIKRDGLQ